MDATPITTIQPVTLRRGEHFPPHVRIVREPGRLPTRRVVRTAADLVRALHPMMSVLEVEQFWAMHLNAQGAVLAYSLISSGAVNASLAYPREAFRAAIGSGASSIVFAHNHPSGDPTPSPEDQAVCRQLVAAGKLLDIGVCDFLILTSDPSVYTSLAQAGLL